MMGIYCFTNRVNGKKYIGQSISIETRKNSHRNCHLNLNYNGYDTKFYRALRKHGFNNFDFEILEECSSEQLNEKEIFYIQEYNSFIGGYNSSIGGDTVASGKGENHHQAILTEIEVLEIKEILKTTTRLQRDIANHYGVNQASISNINRGTRWSDLGDYSYPISNNTATNRRGELNGVSILSGEEVLSIRTRYITETGRNIYKDYESKISYTSFERALTGRTHKDVPIYRKKANKWEEPVSTILG